MSCKIVFLGSAEQDLKELKNHIIKNVGKDTWHAGYRKIKDAVNARKAFPLEGKVPEEIQSLNLAQYRQVISGMNRILYEVRQDTIYIHVICDARKNMRSLLTRRLLHTC